MHLFPFVRGALAAPLVVFCLSCDPKSGEPTPDQPTSRDTCDTGNYPRAGWVCEDNLPVLCSQAEPSDQTRDCRYCPCEEGFGCDKESGVCAPLAALDEPCTEHADCVSKNCSGREPRVCRVALGAQCTGYDCDQCERSSTGYSFCTRSCPFDGTPSCGRGFVCTTLGCGIDCELDDCPEEPGFHVNWSFAPAVDHLESACGCFPDGFDRVPIPPKCAASEVVCDSACCKGRCEKERCIVPLGAGASCSKGADCISGTCVASRCADRKPGSTCATSADCDMGFCSQQRCSAGLLGQTCDTTSQCNQGSCALTPSTSIRSCTYQQGDSCPTGTIDCSGMCRATQTKCAAPGCKATMCGTQLCSEVSFATWSATDHDSLAVVSGLRAASNGGGGILGGRATVSKTSGRWYWEVTWDQALGGISTGVGVGDSKPHTSDFDLSANGMQGVTYEQFGTSGNIHLSQQREYAKVCTFKTGDVIGVALDLTARSIHFSLNGRWLRGEPGQVSGFPLGLSSLEPVFPLFVVTGSDRQTANFGQNPFVYQPPPGYAPGWWQ
jgi:hypothetical protein